MKSVARALLLLAILAPIAGCVVAAPGPAPRYGAHWVPAHYNRAGYWVRGHWT